MANNMEENYRVGSIENDERQEDADMTVIMEGRESRKD